jgi:cysteine synthase
MRQQEIQMKAILISGIALAMLAGAAQAQAVAPVPSGAQPPVAARAPLAKGAHIILRDGDAMVDVKCADDEPMKMCADLTLQILEKLVALPKP